MAKLGRPKGSTIFKTPEEVYDAFDKYLLWCEKNPIRKKELLKSGKRAGEEGVLELPRIPTNLGFCNNAGICEKTFYNYTNGENEELRKAFNHINDYCRSELTDNGLAGTANPAITAMMLGLKHKHEIESTSVDLTGKSEDEIRVAMRAIEQARKK